MYGSYYVTRRYSGNIKSLVDQLGSLSPCPAEAAAACSQQVPDGSEKCKTLKMLKCPIENRNL